MIKNMKERFHDKQEHYYALAHNNQRIGNTVKEARTTLEIGGRAIKKLFQLGVVIRINY